MPYSSQREEGFENRIAQLVARELNASVEYTWWPQRIGFIRNTLKAGECDAVLGIPSTVEMALATRPYYRSTYVFVSRKDRAVNVRSFDDAQLRKLRVGVHVIGDDYAATPPAEALIRSGLARNLVGFSIYGDYSEDTPPARIIDAVESGSIDVAVVWGPLAGYYARRAAAPLDVVPVSPAMDLAFLPMVYDIAIGVRHEDTALRDEIQSILDRRRAEIEKILDEFGVPRV
jgi:quinoprotein dehydrogenase-associated probable ABC transporter substrate-binding protein